MKVSILTRIGASILGLSLILGCEGDGSSSAASGHDFGPNDANVAVALGDSITAGVGIGGAAAYPAQLSARTGMTVINMGVGGQTSAGGLSRVGGALARKPGFLLILFGSNDIIKGTDLGATKENLRGMLRAARANQTIPIIGTVPNGFASHAFMQPGVTALNSMIGSLAREEGVRVAAVAGAIGNNAGLLQSDGLHPTVAGSGKIAGAFAREL
jgi:acyl-CoA thioesterase-1